MEEAEGSPDQSSGTKSAKKNIATILTFGIILGFLIILFAVNIILINLLPGEDKWAWFWFYPNMIIGIRILIVGGAFLEFFLALTLSIYIWKRGRNFIMKHV